MKTHLSPRSHAWARPIWRRRTVLALGASALLSIGRAQDCETLTGALNIGTNVASFSRTDSVSAGAPGDVYRFTIAGGVRQVTASIPRSTTSALVQLSLLRDANNNGIKDAGDLTVNDPPGAAFIHTDVGLSVWLDPGPYFLVVCRTSADTSYQLSLTQTARPDSPGMSDDSRNGSVREVTPSQPLTDSVSVFDSADYGRFVVTDRVAEVSLTIPESSLLGLKQQSGSGNVCLKLFPWAANGDETKYTSDGCSGSASAGRRTVSLWLDQGTYYFRVEDASTFFSGGTEYQVRLTNNAKDFSPGNADNDRASARLLRPTNPTNDFVGISDAVDYYKVVVTGSTTNIEATVPHQRLSKPIRLTLLDDSGAVTLASAVGRPSSPAQDAVVAAVVSPGTYYVRVEPADPSDNEDNTTYLLPSRDPSRHCRAFN